MPHFGDEVMNQVRKLGHPLCVGLDPYLDRIPRLFRRGSMAPHSAETADAVQDFLLNVVDRLFGRAAILKPQMALFEQLGWRGLKVLETIIKKARASDMLVLLDAKRGDIGSTAEGYAKAYLHPDSPLAVDAMTVNPYMGRDAIEPFVAMSQLAHRGVVVLVRNSNPGSSDYQNLACGNLLLYEAVANSLSGIENRLVSPETGWSSLGVTTAATFPERSERVRGFLPRSIFLVLGYGSQGGSAKDAVAGFVKGPKGLEGGLINASRSVLFSVAGDTDDARTWEEAFDSAVSSAIDDIRKAVAA